MTDSHDNTDIDALVSVIQSLQERIRRDGDTIGSNEIRTRTALVDPLLNALGWDTTNPAMVIPEYAAGSGTADYALLRVAPDGNTPVIAFIEAKRLHEPLENHRAQMLTYANMTGVKYAGLTNGDRWELYEVFKEAPLHERRILDVSIRREPAFDCAVKFLPFKWPGLETGEAFSRKSVQRLLFDALENKTSPAVVAMLLDRGANANAKLRDGETLLHWAVRYTEPTVVATLLDHGADINAAEYDHGWTPLHLAARSDQHKEVVALLLERGADKEAMDGFEGTPLHVAAGRGARAAAELLLNGGSNVNIKNQQGVTPLQQAIGMAAWFNETESVVSLLLDRGANIETTDMYGCTPLHSAATSAGKQEFVTLLLNRNANINVTDNAGYTPLHHAVGAGNCFAMRLLLDKGANIEADNHQSLRPLHLASEGLVCNLPVVEGMGPGYPVPDLLAIGIGKYVAETESVEYVDWEATYETIKLLIEYRADRNALTNDGRTAYHIARDFGANEKVLQLLFN